MLIRSGRGGGHDEMLFCVYYSSSHARGQTSRLRVSVVFDGGAGDQSVVLVAAADVEHVDGGVGAASGL